MKFLVGIILFAICINNTYANPWKVEKNDDIIKYKERRLPQEIEPTLPRFRKQFVFPEQYEASLFSAINNQSLNLIEGLINYLGFDNANNIFSQDGENIITYATKNSKINSLEFLLLMGFNPCLPNKNGLLAKQVAMNIKDQSDIKNKIIATIKGMESNGRNNKNNTCRMM